ncbi:MAG: hypothetical protein Q4D47_02410 [Erysipelotrichaceae bacterium]|nr:hypothetical protein [Erysipelotrichaceae bacterium]
MKTLIPMMVAFGIILYLSFCYGLLGRIWFSKIKYTTPLGFYILLGFHHVLMIPFSKFYLDKPVATNVLSTLTYIHIFISSCILIWYLIKHKKNNKFQIDWKDILIVGFFLMACLLTIYFFVDLDPRSPGDNYFYLGYVWENVVNQDINVVDPFSGVIGYAILPIYRFQSYYHLISGLFKVVQSNPFLFSIWIIPLWLVYINVLTIINFLNYKKYSYLLLFVAIPFIVSYGELSQAINGSNFKFSLFVYLYFVYQYFKEKPSNVLAILLFSAGLSLHSTFMFQGLMMLFVMTLLNRKEHNYIDILVYSLLPFFIYLLQFYGYYQHMLWIVLVYALYYGIRKLTKVDPVIFLYISKCIAYVVILVIVVYGVYSVVYSINTPFNAIDFFQHLQQSITFQESYDVFIYGLLLLSLLFNYKQRVVKYSLLMILVFYNPISIYFVSNFITQEVYFRIREVFIQNPVVVLQLIALLNYRKIIIIIASLCALVEFKMSYPSITIYDDVKSNLYRMPYALVDMAAKLNHLDTNVEGKLRASVVSSDVRLRLFTHNFSYLYSVYDERQQQLSIGQQVDKPIWNLVAAMNKSEYFKESLGVISYGIFEYQVDYLVLDKFQAKEIYGAIDNICDPVSENEEYIAYKCYYK